MWDGMATIKTPPKLFYVSTASQQTLEFAAGWTALRLCLQLNGARCCLGLGCNSNVALFAET